MNVLSKTLHATALTLSLVLGHMAPVHAAGPVEVGTIIDLKGTAQAKPGGALSSLDFLTEGSTVELATGATMTVTLYKQGNEYTVHGPTTFQVGSAELKAIKGNAPALVPKATKSSARNFQGGAPERNAGAVILRSVPSSEPTPQPVPDQSPTNTNGAQK